MSSQGRFVWYELMTTEKDAATAFYRAVVGWNAQDSGLPGHDYTILSVDQMPVAGLMPLPEQARANGAPPRWLGYIAVDDVDRFVGQVSEAGGTVHRMPEDIPSVGRFAVVADPHGAMFVLFKPASEGAGPQPAPGTPGHTGWHELMAGNLDSAFAFYSGLFGWTKGQAIDMGPMGVYQIFAINGVDAGGMMSKPADMPRSGWLYYFNVANIDAAAALVTDHGGRITNGPMEVPGGQWILQGTDPQGGHFAVVAPPR